MSKGKTPSEDGTHWVYERHWAGSALVWSAKTSEITGASEEAAVVMAGAGVAGTAKG